MGDFQAMADAAIVQYQRWEDEMVDEIGASLRRVVEMMHPDPVGLTILADVCRRYRAPATLLTGIRIYWRKLSEQKERKKGGENG